MVAKVISGKDIKGALNYNEQKVQEGKAVCIMSNLFKEDSGRLTFFDKLNRFTDLNEKNRRTKTNTLHISLNFDATEKLKIHELNSIATTYMNKIGFGEQPYLVYEHHDAAHQHVHIVTTLIRKDGARIPIHFLGRNESEKARKEIEKEFNLVEAEKQNKSNSQVITPVNIEKAIYGKSLTKKSIASVVTLVSRNYKYTSLPELNAVLRQFNVVADRGHENSTMFEKKGLLYSIIDANGNKIGIPIKASGLPGKPMLNYLEKQFNLNQILRQPHRDKLKTIIDTLLTKPSVTSIGQLKLQLEKHNIHTVFRTNVDGRMYGVTFIDNQSRVVFNGSDLGKGYSANGITERLAIKPQAVTPFRSGFIPTETARESAVDSPTNSIIKDLIQADEYSGISPEAALRLRKRKRRKGPRH